MRQKRMPSNWNKVTYDDSVWLVTKAADIPVTEYPTTYIRKSFELTGIEDYSVMNIRMKWEVWLCISTETDWFVSIWKRGITPSRNQSPFITLFSKFHIILSAVVIVEGTNVTAFEIHGSSYLDSIDFCLTSVLVLLLYQLSR